MAKQMTNAELAALVDGNLPPTRLLEEEKLDPRLDKNSKQFNLEYYFESQPKKTIIINRNESDMMGDPSGKKVITVPVSINGYMKLLAKNRPISVPSDFADHLVDIGAAYIIFNGATPA